MGFANQRSPLCIVHCALLNELQGDTGLGDIERDGMTLDERVVPRLIVAGGEVIADGDVETEA